MKIAVLTDSSAYLTKEQQEKYQIDVLLFTVLFWMLRLPNMLVQ